MTPDPTTRHLTVTTIDTATYQRTGETRYEVSAAAGSIDGTELRWVTTTPPHVGTAITVTITEEHQ